MGAQSKQACLFWISDRELADYLVADMRLLAVGAVRILDKRIIEEARKRRPISVPRLSRFVDLSHTIEHGLVTYKGLPAPIVCDYLSREASRELYAPGTEFQAALYLRDCGVKLVGIDAHNIDDTRGGERPVHSILLGRRDSHRRAPVQSRRAAQRGFCLQRDTAEIQGRRHVSGTGIVGQAALMR